ncbi:MAG: DUF1844 domain-containing protein [Verrucomicrobiota bacterium]
MASESNIAQDRELAQRFVQFVMIQAQNVLFVLGKIPGPDGMAPEPNLEAGKMLIDQLEMIQKKTSGNLSSQEEKILKDTLSELQMAFVEASGGTPASMMPDRSPKMELPPEEDADLPDSSAEEATSTATEDSKSDAPDDTPEKKEPEEDKKKFFKSYG